MNDPARQIKPMTSKPAKLLGEMLIERGSLAVPALEAALMQQRELPGERLGAIMVRMGLLSEQTLLETLALQLEVDILHDEQLSLHYTEISQWHEQQGISQLLATRLSFFAWQDEAAGQLIVASRDVLNSALLEYLDTGPGRASPYRLALVAARDLERVLAQVYRPRQTHEGSTDLRKMAEDAPVVELVNGVMARATDTRASDVHLEPDEAGFAVRYRIDGQLQLAEH